MIEARVKCVRAGRAVGTIGPWILPGRFPSGPISTVVLRSRISSRRPREDPPMGRRKPAFSLPIKTSAIEAAEPLELEQAWHPESGGAGATHRGPDWHGDLIVTNKGQPVGNLANVLLALRNAPEWRGVLAYDEFAVRVVTKESPPWRGPAGKQWSDHDDTLATHWVQLEGIPASHGIVGRAVQATARENGFHPVRNYLNALAWDGVPRLDDWLTTYLGADPSEYVRAVGPRYLISAVARVSQPGCQVDHVPIFESPQGWRKSSALRALAQPWFTDRLSHVGSKDAAMET